MYNYLSTPLKPEEVRQKLSDYLNLRRAQLHIFHSVKAVLDNFDGKTVSKRIATKVQLVLPEHTVSWVSDDVGVFSHKKLMVWKASAGFNVVPFDKRVVFTFRDNVFNFAKYYTTGEGKNYYDLDKQITEMQTMLNKIEEVVQKFNHAQQLLNLELANLHLFNHIIFPSYR